jgi:hypothetical protein
MTEDCQHWVDIADRAVLGERVSGDELAFVTRHEAECSGCAREAAAWRELRPAALHVVPSSDEVDEILRLAEVPKAAPKVARAWQRRWMPAAAAALAAAAAVLALVGGLRTYGPTEGVETPSQPTARQGKSTQAEVGSAQPSERSVNRTQEDTCGEPVSGITVCVASGAELAAVDIAPPHRSVFLKRGHAVASLRPQAPGTSFSIKTEVGRVTAIGTVFSVEVSDDGTMTARVTHGKVMVYGAGDEPVSVLLAGQRLTLGVSGVESLPDEERERDVSLLEAFAPSAPEPSARSARQPPAAPTDELAKARALRARGEFARAADVYRAIHAQSPRSPTGRVALVSLGSLLLASLNDARGALSAFDAYLAGGGGPLRQQAEYGRIRALRALGRKQEERAAVEAFIARYPTAPEARLLDRGEGHEHP